MNKVYAVTLDGRTLAVDGTLTANPRYSQAMRFNSAADAHDTIELFNSSAAAIDHVFAYAAYINHVSLSELKRHPLWTQQMTEHLRYTADNDGVSYADVCEVFRKCSQPPHFALVTLDGRQLMIDGTLAPYTYCCHTAKTFDSSDSACIAAGVHNVDAQAIDKVLIINAVDDEIIGSISFMPLWTPAMSACTDQLHEQAANHIVKYPEYVRVFVEQRKKDQLANEAAKDASKLSLIHI